MNEHKHKFRTGGILGAFLYRLMRAPYLPPADESLGLLDDRTIN
jgi:hypothetical protein